VYVVGWVGLDREPTQHRIGFGRSQVGFSLAQVLCGIVLTGDEQQPPQIRDGLDTGAQAAQHCLG
jgi:hypothetical protein